MSSHEYTMPNMVSYADIRFILRSMNWYVETWLMLPFKVCSKNSYVDIWVYYAQYGFICGHMVLIAQNCFICQYMAHISQYDCICQHMVQIALWLNMSINGFIMRIIVPFVEIWFILRNMGPYVYQCIYNAWYCFLCWLVIRWYVDTSIKWR